MPCVSLQKKSPKFQEESSDLETQLLELGFLCENPDDVGSISASFAYNAHGSMTSMPHLSAMDWDFAEKLSHVTRGTTEAYYSYDGSGFRTRKVVEKNGVIETRLYLGGFEIWRKTVNGVLDTERETLHVMDDKRRIALVETLTVESGNRVAGPAPVQRYQLDNHLGSASLELDDSANIISYEEYYPYGDTSYCAGRSASEVSRKRYRYTGKEKDEESSLYYCEQRYYAAHISRWVSTDPTWLEDGINLYAYVHGNPLSGVDPSGTETDNLNYKYEAYPKLDEVENLPLMAPKINENSEITQSSQKNSIRIISRKEWGAKEPILEENRSWNKIEGKLDDYYHSIIVHHSGNEDNFMTIWELQEKGQKDGYADIPYHFAIDSRGNIYGGRPIDVVGSHVELANTGRIGIVLMADLDTKNDGMKKYEKILEKHFFGNGKLTHGMELALEDLVTYLQKQYRVDTLGGHKELLENRYCPGNMGMEAVQLLRNKLNMNKPQLQKRTRK